MKNVQTRLACIFFYKKQSYLRSSELHSLKEPFHIRFRLGLDSCLKMSDQSSFIHCHTHTSTAGALKEAAECQTNREQLLPCLEHNCAALDLCLVAEQFGEPRRFLRLLLRNDSEPCFCLESTDHVLGPSKGTILALEVRRGTRLRVRAPTCTRLCLHTVRNRW